MKSSGSVCFYRLPLTAEQRPLPRSVDEIRARKGDLLDDPQRVANCPLHLLDFGICQQLELGQLSFVFR